MFRGHFLPLPMHSGGLAVVDLHAIHADVALAFIGRCGACRLTRIAGDHAGERNETASILRPALQNGKIEDVESLPKDDFLAGGILGCNHLGEELAHLGEHGKHANFVEEPFWRTEIHQLLNAGDDFVK